MSKLNNWFISLDLLSTNGLVCNDITGTSEYNNGEIVDYLAGGKWDNDRYLYSEFSDGIGYFYDYGSLSGCNNNTNNSFTTVYELDNGIIIDNILYE